MKLKFVTAVSIISLFTIMEPAFAVNVYTAEENQTISENINQSSEDIKAFFIGTDKNAKLMPVLINTKMTAHGLIGRKMINSKNEAIGTVKDIIIGKNGKASLVIVSDDGLLGIGEKVAAFDYNKVVMQNYDGTISLMLSQDMIDRAADFSYDQKDWAKARVIPTGSISTNALLAGNVLDSKGNKTASIENVYFRNAAVTQIIVGFNKTLGMGGDRASLDYDDMRMIRKGDDVDFKLTENQSYQFKNFKTSVAN
jgi:hypothetical protein